MRIRNNQMIQLQVRPLDVHGQPTDEYEHGTARWLVLSGDASLVEIHQDPNFELAATVRATGLNGVVQIGFDVDGDPGDGTDTIRASGALEIVSSRARSLEITEGVISDQPDEAGNAPATIGQQVGNPVSDAAPAVDRASLDLAASDIGLSQSEAESLVGQTLQDGGIVQAPRYKFNRGGCEDLPDNLFSCYAVYRDSQAVTKDSEDTMVYCKSNDYAKLPMHVNSIADLLSFRAYLTREKATAQGSPSPEPPTEVVVDQSEPSKFPMMGGARVEQVDEPAASEASTVSEQVGAVE